MLMAPGGRQEVEEGTQKVEEGTQEVEEGTQEMVQEVLEHAWSLVAGRAAPLLGVGRSLGRGKSGFVPADDRKAWLRGRAAAERVGGIASTCLRAQELQHQTVMQSS
jgi:hypothetical protein